MEHLADGLVQVFTPPTILWLLLGVAIGLYVGVLPAIGATVGVVVFLPFTYGMDLTTAVVFLLAIYATGQYGDSVTSILINTPGGPGTIASCWDGYPMAKRGQGTRALGIATFGSMVGGIIGTIALTLAAPAIASNALSLQPPEYFALGVMALSLISLASRGQTLRGLTMACFGLAISFVGQDPVSGLVDRFSFGSVTLASGAPELSIFLGMFAIAQVMRMLSGEEAAVAVEDEHSLNMTFAQTLVGVRDVVRHWTTSLRSSAIGVVVGALPALGVTTGTITAYLVEKRRSRRGREFGTGMPEGLVAPETAKGACVVSEMVPAFTLGIPGSLTSAIILAAFLLHGVEPGPKFLTTGNSAYVIFAGIAVTQVLIVAIGLPICRFFGYLTRVPVALLVPALIALCFLGSLEDRSLSSDLLWVVGAGAFGYFAERVGFTTIPLVMGLILGPFLETNFHQTLAIGFGSPRLLWSRPITVVVFALTALFLATPHLLRLWRHLRSKEVDEGDMADAARDIPDPYAAPTAEAPTGLTTGPAAMLALLTAIAVMMLLAARTYPSSVALFPRITAIAMLALIAWQVVGTGAWTPRTVASRLSRLRVPRLHLSEGLWSRWFAGARSGRMQWHAAVLSMLAYYLLVETTGFIVATAIYCIAIPFGLRYDRKVLTVAVGIAMALAIGALTEWLGLAIPGPSLTELL